MDLLSKRYANPCFFIDGMIETGRLCEFVDHIVATTNREEEEQTQWEYYLHRVYDKSFEDFRNDLKTEAENRNMSARTIETTVQHSMSILQKFNPEKRG